MTQQDPACQENAREQHGAVKIAEIPGRPSHAVQAPEVGIEISEGEKPGISGAEVCSG